MKQLKRNKFIFDVKQLKINKFINSMCQLNIGNSNATLEVPSLCLCLLIIQSSLRVIGTAVVKICF